MPSLSDKLKALGVKVGARDLPAPASGHAIDSVVSGAFRPTALGEVFVAEQVFQSDHLHGRTGIVPPTPLARLARWARDEALTETPLESFAFLDTETSGLAGGTGTYAFLVGVGRFVQGQFTLQQFFMRDPAEEPAMLEGLANFLAPCSALVTFNGKAFDAPLLVTRYSLNRIPLPFKGYSHVDLLPLARRLWRDRLPSRALKYLEEHVLGMRRTEEEVPGYEIPWLYFDYLRSGDARPLRGVFYHNAMDIVAMAALLAHTGGMLANPYDGRIEHGQDYIALAKLFEDLQEIDEARRLYERGLESALTQEDFGVAVRRLSSLHKRGGDLREARALWEQASEAGHMYAFIELAKYYEHRERDAKTALKWTKSAQRRVKQLQAPAYVRAHWRLEIEHRLKRLQRKAGL